MTQPADLSSMLSHLLLAFERDYSDSSHDLPSLAMLSNILRVIGPAGVDAKDLPARARISKRAARIATQYLARDKWLTIENSEENRGKIVRLTSAGTRVRDLGQTQQQLTEQAWETRYGARLLNDLRDSLRKLVTQVDVELPHYPASYGQGDPSVTGGGYVPGNPGPPRLPGHGTEWPVVLRSNGDGVSKLALTSWASQALTAFTIDYDESVESQLGGLHGVVTFLRLVHDGGMALGEAAKIADVNGTGRAGFERHRLVTVEPKKRGGGERLVTLTALGKRVCDRYPARVIEIEEHWRSRYGAKVVKTLRTALEAFDANLGDDLPDYPDVAGWLRRAGSRRVGAG